MIESLCLFLNFMINSRRNHINLFTSYEKISSELHLKMQGKMMQKSELIYSTRLLKSYFQLYVCFILLDNL